MILVERQHNSIIAKDLMRRFVLLRRQRGPKTRVLIDRMAQKTRLDIDPTAILHSKRPSD